jgi:hypothetical protein
LTVSTGVRIIRKSAAAVDANTVWMSFGSLRRKPFDSSSARMPAFAAVSPKLRTRMRMHSGEGHRK